MKMNVLIQASDTRKESERDRVDLVEALRALANDIERGALTDSSQRFTYSVSGGELAYVFVQAF